MNPVARIPGSTAGAGIIVEHKESRMKQPPTFRATDTGPCRTSPWSSRGPEQCAPLCRRDRGADLRCPRFDPRRRRRI